LNLRSPGKGGASAILFQGGESWGTQQLKLSCVPTVNLIDDSSSTRNTVDVLKVLAYPVNKVILIDTLDDLVQQIGRD
jgi:hypothetical protein